MQIHKNGNKLPKIPFSIVTPGMFDGVHLGHLSLVQKLKELAIEKGGETVILTYWPHPRTILHPEKPPLPLLTTLEEKLALFEWAGIDHVVILPFTKSFSELHADEFVENILIRNLQTKVLVVGYDHHFGNTREGHFEYLFKNKERFGFDLIEIPAKFIDEMAVSSTKIRFALQAGNIEAVKHFLGRSYSLSGKVIEGNQRGRTIGFPTANLHLEDKSKLIPADGVYAVKVLVKNEQKVGMLNIGFRPTFDGKTRTIEVHILDFQEDIYNEIIKIEFEHFLRPEKIFKSIEELKFQLLQDLKTTRKHFT